VLPLLIADVEPCNQGLQQQPLHACDEPYRHTGHIILHHGVNVLGLWARHSAQLIVNRKSGKMAARATRTGLSLQEKSLRLKSAKRKIQLGRYLVRICNLSLYNYLPSTSYKTPATMEPAGSSQRPFPALRLLSLGSVAMWSVRSVYSP
jgi:hypothetical protein